MRVVLIGVWMLAACGDGGGVGGDAPPGTADASSDASTLSPTPPTGSYAVRGDVAGDKVVSTGNHQVFVEAY